MLLALIACGGGAGEDQPPAASGGLQPTLDSIQANIFTPTCAKSSCHTGAGAPEGLRLDAGLSHMNLVNVPVPRDTALTRVIPGMPDASFLIEKLEGTQTIGAQMPDDGPPYLQAAQIQVIKEWILNGAPQ